MREIKHPTTGIVYSIEHLKPFTVTYNVFVDKLPVSIPLVVIFSNHCYTRSKNDKDLDIDILSEEKKKNGDIDCRVFCPDRWGFSFLLVDIIKELHSKLCLSGKSKELFYRQEKPIGSGVLHEGWYICLKLDVSQKHKNLVLNVRSSHYRTNRPFEAGGGTNKFYSILSEFYKKESKKYAWLKKDKSP